MSEQWHNNDCLIIGLDFSRSLHCSVSGRLPLWWGHDALPDVDQGFGLYMRQWT
ncbi:hypothetical protein SynBIOSE41_00153 [Synechococcus sp. BIOS-E4-1]|nr:hypothetical protein SynBIOSE41_00153 [Synechococcus sp. BIOS-E4-1]